MSLLNSLAVLSLSLAGAAAQAQALPLEEVWRQTFEVGEHRAWHADADLIIVVGTERIAALSSKTGALRWRVDSPVAGKADRTPLTRAGGYVYIGESGGVDSKIHVLQASDGRLLASIREERELDERFIPIGDRLIYALEPVLPRLPHPDPDLDLLLGPGPQPQPGELKNLEPKALKVESRWPTEHATPPRLLSTGANVFLVDENNGRTRWIDYGRHGGMVRVSAQIADEQRGFFLVSATIRWMTQAGTWTLPVSTTSLFAFHMTTLAHLWTFEGFPLNPEPRLAFIASSLPFEGRWYVSGRLAGEVDSRPRRGIQTLDMDAQIEEIIESDGDLLLVFGEPATFTRSRPFAPQPTKWDLVHLLVSGRTYRLPLSSVETYTASRFAVGGDHLLVLREHMGSCNLRAYRRK
jgi:hypothetical protein